MSTTELKKIAISKHAKERFVERILGIPKEEVKSYLAKNESIVEEHILEMYTYSEKIWSGQLFGNITRNYYLRDDIVIVVDTNDQCIVTVFYVDFGLTRDGNRRLVKVLLEEKEQIEKDLEKVNQSIQEEIAICSVELEQVESEISLLKSRLEGLTMKRDAIKMMIEGADAKKNDLNDRIDTIMKMICSSIEFKKDILELTTNKK